MSLTKPVFIDETPATIIAEMKADLEARLNRVISPADVEMLLIQAFAFRESLVRVGINEAARQNLVSFSTGSALEYLGQLVGVQRLPPATALTTIQFDLVPNHNGVYIPIDIRVQTTDGKAIFKTIESVTVPFGTISVQVAAECSTPGVIGNGYEANKVSIILDPIAFVATAQNIDTTAGGSDEETDLELRERIKLAPASFSVAGPKGAYIYFAKSAHPSIVDVSVTSPIPGQVNIYPLMEGGVLPTQEILDSIFAICNGDKVRPLTDTVIVDAPTKTDYDINVELTLISGASNSLVTDEVMTALTAFKNERKNQLGKDVVRSQITALCMLKDKVYDCNVVEPATDIVANPDVYTNCNSITITVTGESDE